MRVRGLAVVALLCALLPASALARTRGETRVLALVPEPGYPALAYVHPNGRIYEGTYVNPSGDTVPSRVLEYTDEGTLLRSWVVDGQDLGAAHGVQVAASDARGRLVLLDRTPSRALLLDRTTGEQTTYATFADLKPCAPGTTGPDCSPTTRDQPPMADYAAWGPDGSLYVTDYEQAVVWAVPPGGGAARVWLADKRLDGDTFGTAGIKLAADGRSLIISQASSAGGGGGNPATGRLYVVGIGADGRPAGMRQLWESGPAEAPDGFAIARSGRLYVALVGPASQIVTVAPDGREVERFGAAGTGDNGSAVPFDASSSVNFLGTRLIVANQAFSSGDRTHQAILDVEAGEEGLPVLIPANAGGTPPAAASPPARPRGAPKHRARGHRSTACRRRAHRRRTRAARRRALGRCVTLERRAARRRHRAVAHRH